MIKYGLKLWTSNERSIFEEAIDLCCRGETDFVELYHNPDAPLDWQKFSLLAETPVTIHHTHSHGWHEFKIGEQQLAIWQNTLKLTDFFNSPHIIVHPGQAKNFDHLVHNLKKFDDPRILFENMAGLDIYGQNVYARTIEELKAIRQLKEICFDLEKAVKSAKYQNIDYQEFITACLNEFKPFYFHLSGGDKNNPMDEHKNLWEANFDIEWLNKLLNSLARARDIFLVFETPKLGANLKNDLANLRFFKKPGH